MDKTALGYVSPSKMEQARLCLARLNARLTDDEYDEEHGEGARQGTLAHDAAKHWYRDREQKLSMDQCFKLAIEEVGKNGELPMTAAGIQEARTLFDTIADHYPRHILKIVFAERRYKGTLANGVPVHLIIDLAIDRGNGHLEICDYKTGYLSINTEEMYNKDQVLMNLLAVSRDQELAAYPTKSFSYYWVRKGFETGKVELSMDRLADYETYLAVSYQNMLDEAEPEETLNQFCTSCGRRNKCTKYRQFMAEAFGTVDIYTPEQMQAMTHEQLMGQHSKLKGQIDLLEDARKGLGAFLMGVMSKGNTTELLGEKFKANIRQNKSDDIDVLTLMSICTEFNVPLAPLVDAKKKAVMEKFADNPLAMTRLQQSMHRSATNPFIIVGAMSAKKATGKKKEKAAPVSATPSGLPVVPMEPAQAQESPANIF